MKRLISPYQLSRVRYLVINFTRYLVRFCNIFGEIFGQIFGELGVEIFGENEEMDLTRSTEPAAMGASCAKQQ